MRRMWAYRPTGVMEAGHAAGVGIPPFGGWRPDMRRMWAYRNTGVRGVAWGRQGVSA